MSQDELPSGLSLAALPFSLFYNQPDFGDKITLCARLRDAAGGAFDGETLILPQAVNAPVHETLRIQMASRDQSLVLQISAVRLNIEWTRREAGAASWAERAPGFFRVVEGVLRVFAGEYARPARFALNPRFLHRVEGSANDYLARRILAPGRFGHRPVSAKLSLLDRLEAGGRAMNLWMNVSTARHQQNPALDDALVIHFDFNSAPEDQRPIAVEEIMGAMTAAESEFAARVRPMFGDLFPEEDGAAEE